MSPALAGRFLTTAPPGKPYNSLLTGLPKASAVCFYTASRVNVKKCKSDHVTSLLRILQWLPISLRTKPRVLAKSHRATHDPGLCPLPDLTSFITPHFWQASHDGILTVPGHTKHVPTLGSLYLLSHCREFCSIMIYFSLISAKMSPLFRVPPPPI